jgi:hypothetical protein
MKFAYSLKQKGTIVLLLFLIMACTVLIRVLEDKSIKNLEKAFSTLYYDRLIPATDIFHISEKLYAKRVILETYIYSSEADKKAVEDQLNKYDIQIQTLIEKYEKTYLVSNEKDQLGQLKAKILAARNFENSVLNNDEFQDESDLKEKLLDQSEASFLGISNSLSQLTNVQTVVGEELQTNTKKIISGSNFYSTLQLILAVVIGILIVSILFASNVVNIKSDKYHLN